MEVITVTDGKNKVQTTRLYWETEGIHNMPTYHILESKPKEDVRMQDKTKTEAKTEEVGIDVGRRRRT